MIGNAPEDSSEATSSPAPSRNGGLLPKVGKYGVIAAVGLIAVGVMMSRHGISCSSADARETVGNIAREHQALVVDLALRGGGEAATCEQNAQCSNAEKELGAAKAAVTQLIDGCNAIASEADYDACPTADGVFHYTTDVMASAWGTTINDGDGNPIRASARKTFMDQHNSQQVFARWKAADSALTAAKENLQSADRQARDAKWQEAAKNLQYQLENIIMTATDKDTGSVSCKADLVGEVPDWGSATKPITYTVEKTSDGDLYATVWGI